MKRSFGMLALVARLWGMTGHHRTRRAVRRLPGTSGAALIEFVLILPVMLLLLAAVAEFGRLFVVYAATNRLATNYALAWANCSENNTDTNGVCSNELANYTTAFSISNVVPQLVVANLTLTMAEFTVSSGGTATAIYSGGYPAVDATQLAEATTRAAGAFTLFPGPSAVQYVVVVEVRYTHSLQFFSTLISPFLGSYLTPSFTTVQLKS